MKACNVNRFVYILFSGLFLPNDIRNWRNISYYEVEDVWTAAGITPSIVSILNQPDRRGNRSRVIFDLNTGVALPPAASDGQRRDAACQHQSYFKTEIVYIVQRSVNKGREC